MKSFRTARGHFEIEDGVIRIYRPESRLAQITMRPRRVLEQHPIIYSLVALLFPAWFALGLLLGLDLTTLIEIVLSPEVYYPALAVAIVAVPVVLILVTYSVIWGHRIKRNEGEAELAQPREISLEHITKVNAYSSIIGYILHVHYRDENREKVTQFQFLRVMKDEFEAAQDLLANRGITVESPNSAKDEDRAIPDSDSTISRWWWGVAGPTVFGGILWLIREVIYYGIVGEDVQFALLFPALISWVLLFFTVIFLPISMLLDTRRIRASGVRWKPNPFLWGLIGLLPIVSFVVASQLLTVVVLVGGGYLIRRYGAIGFR